MNTRRVAALVEVLGVFGAGQLVTGQLVRLLHISAVNPLEKLTVEASNAELLTATRQMLMLLMLQYAGYFLLIIPINWWHRRRSPAAYGLTRAGHSWNTLLVAGLATFSLTMWPGVGVTVANAIHPLGETVPWRKALFDMSWHRWQFWLFTAVLSWAFIPVIEELFFRGYCQRRLAEDWGDGPAIVGIACMFTFAHSQYHALNAYNAGMIVTLLVMATGFGVAFAWTRSLLPAIIAHAIIDIPMTPFWSGVVLTAFAVVAVLTCRRGWAAFKQVFSSATAVACIALALIGIGYAIAQTRFELKFFAAAMVVLAVGLEVIERRQQKRFAKAAAASA